MGTSRGRRLIIAGAGGFGRELAAYARDAGFVVAGFLDDDDGSVASLDGADRDAGVIETIDGYVPREDDEVAVGIGHIATRLRVAERLIDRGARLASVVHPSAWIAPTASLGVGIAVAPYACVGPGVTVGDLSLINTYASLGHDAVLGRCCVLASYSVATGHSVLEDEVFLATHAVVIPGQKIGAQARVSAGAVVFHDVPSGCLAAGNPARARPVPEGRPTREEASSEPPVA
jgi:sugar O-acyltransferase (sialic acid O-acetyltransferase NeuD family)